MCRWQYRLIGPWIFLLYYNVNTWKTHLIYLWSEFHINVMTGRVYQRLAKKKLAGQTEKSGWNQAWAVLIVRSVRSQFRYISNRSQFRYISIFLLRSHARIYIYTTRVTPGLVSNKIYLVSPISSLCFPCLLSVIGDVSDGANSPRSRTSPCNPPRLQPAPRSSLQFSPIHPRT